jgi:hypothetical protein
VLVREAVRGGGWKRLAALVRHLPPDSATGRAQARFTVGEQLQSFHASVAQAQRAEALLIAGAKRGKAPKVVDPLAELTERLRPTPPPPPGQSASAVWSRLVGAGGRPAEKGGE